MPEDGSPRARLPVPGRVAIVLAAGSSRRFGRANKLLSRWRGAPLLLQALRIAHAAPAARVILVTGHDRLRISALARRGRRPIDLVHARDHRSGIAASLRAGLAAMRRHERSAFIVLGDMPAVPPAVATRLVPRLRPGFAAARPIHRGQPGHPVLLARPSALTLRKLRGDRGFGALIGARTAMPPASGGAVLDIDRPRPRGI
ncbi:nucleotidyltransferase family protein [Sphingomonas sp. 1P06PA]|uniref:nucleotidyltransferase family protein n=1 Tax=Sphingomonas sp. 1P06PA TaxID=554121 RepID=UPI0039A630F2